MLQEDAGLVSMVHYLDNFLFTGRHRSGQCVFLLQMFLNMVDELGVSLTHEKTEGPATMLTFLGIEIDTVQQCSRLLGEKLPKLRGLVAWCLAKSKLCFLELQQLAGHLNFACKVMAPGRPFVWCFCDAMTGLCRPHHRMRVMVGMQEDLLMW